MKSNQLLVIYDVLQAQLIQMHSYTSEDEHTAKLYWQIFDAHEAIRQLLLKRLAESEKLKVGLWIKSQEEKIENIRSQSSTILDDNDDEILKNTKYPRRPPIPVMPRIKSKK
jgi:hypothetical protein